LLSWVSRLSREFTLFTPEPVQAPSSHRLAAGPLAVLSPVPRRGLMREEVGLTLPSLPPLLRFPTLSPFVLPESILQVTKGVSVTNPRARVQTLNYAGRFTCPAISVRATDISIRLIALWTPSLHRSTRAAQEY
jgi:hypothetical protein